jgi:hypothetical protein
MIKKWNWTATIFAIINIVSLLSIEKYLDGLGQGMAIMGVFIFPAYIIVFSSILLTVAIIKRKTWFKKEILFSTIFMLIFCTPLPFIISWSIAH